MTSENYQNENEGPGLNEMVKRGEIWNFTETNTW